MCMLTRLLIDGHAYMGPTYHYVHYKYNHIHFVSSLMPYGVTRGYPVTVSTRFIILDLSNFRQALNCLEEAN